MMAVVNEHGIIVGGESVVLAHGHNYHALVKVAQHPETRRWTFGAQVTVGTTYSSSPPRAADATFDTRQDAIDAGRQYVVSIFEKQVEWETTYSDGSRRAINPAVGKAIESALREIAAGQQLDLFSGASNV